MISLQVFRALDPLRWRFRRKEAEDVALAIRLSMWRHLRDINREAKARNSSVLICHFLAGSLTTIVAILPHLGTL